MDSKKEIQETTEGLEGQAREVRMYSPQFKKKILAELRGGVSAYALSLKYGIGGADTVNRWARNSGVKPSRSKKVLVCTSEEVDEITRLRNENAQLKTLISQIVESLEIFEQICSEIQRLTSKKSEDSETSENYKDTIHTQV